jgi:uncharacterized protein DUF350
MLYLIVLTRFSSREPASTPFKNAPGAHSMILQSLAGLPAFLVYFCTALVAVVAYLFVYTRVTPHDEFQLIRDNDPAAAIALGLSLLGFVLPLVSAIAHSANVVDCRMRSRRIFPAAADDETNRRRPARCCETLRFGLPVNRNSASMRELEYQGLNIRAWLSQNSSHVQEQVML